MFACSRLMSCGFGSTVSQYWMGRFITADTTTTRVSVDPAGNIYTAGSLETDLLISKMSPTGSLLWQRTVSAVDVSTTRAIATDSSSNLYVLSRRSDSPSNSYTFTVVYKYNSSGTLLWQRLLYTGNTSHVYGYDICTDDSDGVYVVGQWGSSPYSHFIVKLNDSGIYQWDVRGSSAGSYSGVYYQPQTTTLNASGLMLSVNNNFLPVADWFTTTGFKVGNSNIIDQNFLPYDSSNAVISFRQSTSDSTGSYWVGRYTDGPTLLYLIKPGQWYRQYSITGSDFYGMSVISDGLTSVYVLGRSAGTTTGYVILKIDRTNGSVVWSRILSVPLLTDYVNLSIDGDALIVGTSHYVARLPTDGTLVGTYDVSGLSVTYSSVGVTPVTITGSSSGFSTSDFGPDFSTNASASTSNISNADWSTVTL